MPSEMARSLNSGGGLMGSCEHMYYSASQQIHSLVSSRKSRDMLSWVSEVAV